MPDNTARDADLRLQTIYEIVDDLYQAAKRDGDIALQHRVAPLRDAANTAAYPPRESQ